MRSRFLFALPLVAAVAFPAMAQQTSSNTTTSFDAWVMGCSSRTADSKVSKACEIRSTLVLEDPQTKQQGVAAVIAVGRLAVDKPELQFVVQLPSNAILNVPVRISGKDGKPAIELPFVACQQQVCIAASTITDTQLSAMKKIGENFYINYRNQMGQEPKIEGSTKGFDKALDAMVRER